MNTKQSVVLGKDISAAKKGQILAITSLVIGVIGFLFFIGSIGEPEFKIPTNYLGMGIGLLLMIAAAILGSRPIVQEYMDKNHSNEA